MNEVMTYQQLLKEGEMLLQKANIQDARTDAWYLMSDAFHMDRAAFYLHGADPVDDDAACGRFREMVAKRMEGVPVQYLTGTAAFMGLEFEVSPAVLIPRQDTETLVETALGKIDRPMRILDMCTGSGCIILSLAALNPEVSGCGVDISKEALDVARRNRDRLGVTRIDLIQSDLFENVTGTYDMIVSNPPYIRPDVIETLMTEVRDNEPRLALDGGPDGLDFYRALASRSGKYLVDGGWLVMEIGCDQARDVKMLLKDAGYKEITVVKDLPGLDRVVCGRK